MASREDQDRDTEQKVRIEQETPRNGKNGKTQPFLIEAATAQRGENSVEKSLEDFIARANSTFLEADGWDLTPEVSRKTKSEAKPAARADGKPATAEQAQAAKATAKTAVPAAPAKVVTKTNWTGVILAFLGGALLVFGVMKLTGNGAGSDAPAVNAAAVPTQVVEPAQQPVVAPIPTEVAAPAPTPVEVAAPAAEPAVQPLEAQPTATDTKADAKPEKAKTDAKSPAKREPRSAATTPTDVKPADVKPAEEKVPAKKKKAAPKGGIVDPFAM